MFPDQQGPGYGKQKKTEQIRSRHKRRTERDRENKVQEKESERLSGTEEKQLEQPLNCGSGIS